MPGVAGDRAAFNAVLGKGLGASSYLAIGASLAPVARYRLNDPGAQALDATGNGHTGTLSGGIQTGAPSLITNGDPAMLFNGTSGQITIPDAPWNQFGLGSFTVEGWVNVLAVNQPSPKSSSLALRKGQTPGWAFGEGSSATGVLYRIGDGTNNLIGTISPAVGFRPQDTVGKPTHVVWVIDRAAQLLRLYINGTAQGTANIAAVGSVSAPGQPLTLSPGAGQWFMNGTMGQVAFYAAALTPAQILNNYLAGREPIVPHVLLGEDRGASALRSIMLGDNPLAYYWLEEGVADGIVVPDHSIHGAAGAVSSPSMETKMRSYGPTAYWRCGEAAGHLVDEVAARNSVSEAASLVYAQPGGLVGDPDTAVLLDGIARPQIAMANTPALCGAFSSLALVAMFKTSLNDASLQWIVCEMDGVTRGGYRAYVQSGRVFTGVRSYASNGNVDKVTEMGSAAATYADGNWHLLLMFFAASNLYQYVDGVLTAGPTAHVATVDSSGLQFQIGSSQNFGGSFNGEIDEVAFWGGILPVTVGNQLSVAQALWNVARRPIQAAGVLAVPGGLTVPGDLAFQYDGASGHVECPSIAIATGSPFSFETWANVRGLSQVGANGYVCLAGYDGNHRFLWNAPVAGQSGGLLTQFGGVNFQTAFGLTQMAFGKWVQIVYTYDGTNQNWYVNGVLLATAVAPTAGNAPGWGSAFKLGAYDLLNYMMNGSQDDTAFFGYAQSPAQIQNHYLAGLEKLAARATYGDRAA